MWWTERRLYILLAVVTVVSAVVFGWVGYDIAQHPSPPMQIIFQPGAIVITAAPAPTPAK